MSAPQTDPTLPTAADDIVSQKGIPAVVADYPALLRRFNSAMESLEIERDAVLQLKLTIQKLESTAARLEAENAEHAQQLEWKDDEAREALIALGKERAACGGKPCFECDETGGEPFEVDGPADPHSFDPPDPIGIAHGDRLTMPCDYCGGAGVLRAPKAVA